MSQRSLQYWQHFFIPISLTHRVCQHLLWNARPYAWSLFSCFCSLVHFLSSSLVQFKNDPVYLTRGTAQVFISLTRFLLLCFVSSSFLVLPRYSLLVFFFNSTCLMVSTSNFPKYLYVSFSQSVLNFSWFGSLSPSVMCRLPLFILSFAYFSMLKKKQHVSKSPLNEWRHRLLWHCSRCAARRHNTCLLSAKTACLERL